MNLKLYNRVDLTRERLLKNYPTMRRSSAKVILGK